jgi:hypothetical protein
MEPASRPILDACMAGETLTAVATRMGPHPEVVLRQLWDAVQNHIPELGRQAALTAENADLRAALARTQRLVESVAEDAIGLFLEYRDVHGVADEDQAKARALHEVAEGLAAIEALPAFEREAREATDPPDTTPSDRPAHARRSPPGERQSLPSEPSTVRISFTIDARTAIIDDPQHGQLVVPAERWVAAMTVPPGHLTALVSSYVELTGHEPSATLAALAANHIRSALPTTPVPSHPYGLQHPPLARPGADQTTPPAPIAGL